MTAAVLGAGVGAEAHPAARPAAEGPPDGAAGVQGRRQRQPAHQPSELLQGKWRMSNWWSLCMPSESYRRRLRSLLLCLCDVFRALINSFVYCYFKVNRSYMASRL